MSLLGTACAPVTGEGFWRIPADLLFCAGSADKGDGPVPGVRVRFATVALATCALPCMNGLSVPNFNLFRRACGSV